MREKKQLKNQIESYSNCENLNVSTTVILSYNIRMGSCYKDDFVANLVDLGCGNGGGGYGLWVVVEVVGILGIFRWERERQMKWGVKEIIFK